MCQTKWFTAAFTQIIVQCHRSFVKASWPFFIYSVQGWRITYMYILVIGDKDPDNFVHTPLTLLSCSLCHGVQPMLWEGHGFLRRKKRSSSVFSGLKLACFQSSTESSLKFCHPVTRLLGVFPAKRDRTSLGLSLYASTAEISGVRVHAQRWSDLGFVIFGTIILPFSQPHHHMALPEE